MSQVQSGRSWVEVDGPDESKDKSERSNNVKVDGLKLNGQTGPIWACFQNDMFIPMYNLVEYWR